MKLFQILVLFCVISMSMTAQNVTVKGKLVSADDKAGLPYVTISVARESNPANTVKRLATQENGTFSTALTPRKIHIYFPFCWDERPEETC